MRQRHGAIVSAPARPELGCLHGERELAALAARHRPAWPVPGAAEAVLVAQRAEPRGRGPPGTRAARRRGCRTAARSDRPGAGRRRAATGRSGRGSPAARAAGSPPRRGCRPRAASASTSSRCASSSVRPGSTGATRTNVRIPAAAKRPRISSRLRPGGVPGSTTLRTSSSSVPTLIATLVSATSASRQKRSRSRTTIVDLVSIDIGFRSPRRPRRLRASAGSGPRSAGTGRSPSPSRPGRPASAATRARGAAPRPRSS